MNQAPRPALQRQIDEIDTILGKIVQVRTESHPEGNRDWALKQRGVYADQCQKGTFSTRDADEAIRTLRKRYDALCTGKDVPASTSPRPNVPQGYYAIKNR